MNTNIPNDPQFNKLKAFFIVGWVEERNPTSISDLAHSYLLGFISFNPTYMICPKVGVEGIFYRRLG